MLTQVAPTLKQVLNGITVYEWYIPAGAEVGGGTANRFAFQLGGYIVDIEAGRPEAGSFPPDNFRHAGQKPANYKKRLGVIP